MQKSDQSLHYSQVCLYSFGTLGQDEALKSPLTRFDLCFRDKKRKTILRLTQKKSLPITNSYIRTWPSEIQPGKEILHQVYQDLPPLTWVTWVPYYLGKVAR